MSSADTDPADSVEDGGARGCSLHAELLCVLRDAAKLLEKGTSFGGDDAYLDLFGAVLAPEDARTVHLQRVAERWVRHVRTALSMRVDALLTPKSGNIILADRVAHDLGVPLIVAKSPSEPSRVVEGKARKRQGSRPEPILSPVNFEGLEEFLEVADRDAPKLRILVFDDSCTTGRSIRDAVGHLNALIADRPDEYPIELISDAVVLFRRDAPDDTLRGRMSVHALLQMNAEDIRQLLRMERSTDAATFDQFASELMEEHIGSPSLATSVALHPEAAG